MPRNWFRETIECGRECGLSDVGEAILNMELHFPFADEELREYLAAVRDWEANGTLDLQQRLDEVFDWETPE